MSQPVTSEFTDFVTDKLDLVEEELARQAGADTPFVTEAANHIISAGGKRFRPLLVVLSSQLARQDPDDTGTVSDQDLVRAAVVMELTHVASLYHDDVMDEATLRRGAESANQRWGNSVAIMVGDYLFARASEAVAGLGTDFVRLQAQTFARLVQGQIAETRGPQPGEDPLQHYLDVVADKTGSLISAAAVFGGMVAGLPQTQLAVLRRFGEEIGLVFQLADDLLDIWGDTAVTGKPASDLRTRRKSAPVVYAMAASPELRDRYAADTEFDEAATARVIALIEGTGARAWTEGEAGARTRAAWQEIDGLPLDPVARGELSQLAAAILDAG